MEKLHVYKSGIWYSGMELEEESIKTEPYINFRSSFSQQLYDLKKMGFEIEDHYSDPFSEIEQFSYYFDDDSGCNVYVREDWDPTIKNHILIGIRCEMKNATTCDEVIAYLMKYKDLKNKIAKLFRNEYEIMK